MLGAEGLPTKRLYFAPGFLKRYRPQNQGTVTTSPHEGRQYGSFLAAAKILVLLFEFTVGVHLLRRRSEVLLFDRFIHDLLVDPVRYRLGRVKIWMRWILKLAPTPDLVVIVTAPPATIQARKQEVPLAETIRQVGAYQALGRTFRRAVHVQNDGDPDLIAREIVERISSYQNAARA